MNIRDTLLKVQKEYIAKEAKHRGVSEEEVIAVWIKHIREAMEDIDNDL